MEVSSLTERSLEGRVAIITGGAQGIGRATALRFARAGCDVVICDLLDDLAERTREELRALGIKAEARRVDVANVDEDRAFIDWTVSTFGRLDILVNNAALRQGPAFYDVTKEQWDRFFAVNSRGTFFLIQAAGKIMARQGYGRIINISSIAARAWWGAPCPPYSASKASIINISRTTTLELAPHGVTVNTVCPGLTRTAVFEGMAMKANPGLGRDEALAVVDRGRMIPAGKSNEADDIASCIFFLASEEARHITGQTINVDGGLVFESGVSQPSDFLRSATAPLR